MCLCYLFYHFLHITLAVTGARLHGASDRLIEVEAFLCSRTDSRRKRHKLRDRRHLVAYLDEDIIQRRRIQTIFRRSARHDTIDLAILVEVTDIRTTAVCTERVQNHIRGDTGSVTLRSIDIDLVFREGLAVERHCHLHLGVFLKLSEEVIHNIVELRHVTSLQVLHLEIDCVTITITGNLRHLERNDLCVFDILAREVQFRHHIIDIVLDSLTLIPRFEADDKRTIAHTGTGDQTETGDLGITLHFFEPQHVFLYLRHDLIGLHERRTGWSCDIHHDHTLVLLRHKSGRQSTHSEHHHYCCSNEPNPRTMRFLKELSHTVLVFA